ncbi:FG-GAP-like repeat-containing protein [Calditrichota bacterium GD2]
MATYNFFILKLSTAFLILNLSSIIYGYSSFQNNDTLKLQFFPELKEVHIHSFIYKDPFTVFLYTYEGSFRWTGKRWVKIQVPFLTNLDNYYIYPYDSLRFLISYRPHERFYHSRLVFFNGRQWKKIDSPQPFSITTVDFIDSVRFVAAGIWGSLISFDGHSTKILNSLPVADYYKIWSFKKDEIIAFISDHQLRLKNRSLVKFSNGRWKRLANISQTVNAICFWHPDSGFMITANGQGYLYNKKRLKKIFDLQASINSAVFNPEEKALYYWHNKAFWKITLPFKKEKLFAFTQPGSIYPFEHGYLIKLGRKLYYKGSKLLGIPFHKSKPSFYFYRLFTKNSYSISVYESDAKEKHLYLVSPEYVNRFLKFNFNKNGVLDPIHIKDVVIPSGLLDHSEDDSRFDSNMAFADLDNDGDRDAILFYLHGQAQFFENIGDDRFKKITHEVGLPLSGRIARINLVDFNLDGYIDIVIGDELGPMRFIRNKGYMRFDDVTPLLHLPDSLITYLPAMADLDGDGDADLVAYSLYNPIKYYENVGLDQTNHLPVFKDISSLSPQLTGPLHLFTQSVSFADYDNDGDLDILLSNRNAYLKLFENKGSHLFLDVSVDKKISYKLFAYGASWGDLDWDGDLDFVLATLGKNYIFWNQDGRYFQIDSTTLAENDLSYTTGSILDDIDEDGDLDIIFSNYFITYDRLHFNMLDKDSYIKIQLHGGKDVNSEGIGSNIYLYETDPENGENKLIGYRYIQPETGLNSFKLPEAYFGVDENHAYNAKIQYPGGKVIEVRGLRPGNSYLIKESSALESIFFSALDESAAWIFRKSKRLQIAKFMILISIFLIFNVIVYKRTYWPIFHVFFFNTFLLSLYLILVLFFANLSTVLGAFFPFYIMVTLSIPVYLLIEKYTIFRYENEYRHEIYDLFRQFKHSKNGLSQINHLIFFCNNMKEPINIEIAEDFKKELSFFKTYSFPFIKKVLTGIIRLGDIEGNPESVIKLLKSIYRQADKLSSAEKFTKKKIEQLKRDLLQLKNRLLLLLKKMELKLSCDVIATISQMLKQFPEFTEVKFHRDPSHKLPKVIIPEETLAQVLGNIFQNALDAMQNTKRKKIEISISGGYNLVTIDIHDYGMGIPEENRDKIFKSNFSSKGSTGLGLYHAMKLVKKYEGDIQLIDTSPHKGTTFRLLLKGVKDD